MNLRALFLAAFSAALLLAGCSKNIDTADAVKTSVIKDVSKKMDVKNMDVNVVSVAFRGTEADAAVSFSPKGVPAGQSIVMKYTLTRDGEEWKIKARALEAQGAHAATGGAPGGEMPAGHPGAAGGAAPGAAPDGAPLPSGHPTMGGGAPGGGTMVGPGGIPMPAGHMPVAPAPASK